MRTKHAWGLALSLLCCARPAPLCAQAVPTRPPSSRSLAVYAAGGVLGAVGIAVWTMRAGAARTFNQDCWVVDGAPIGGDFCASRYDDVLVPHVAAITAWSLSAGLAALGTAFVVLDHGAPARDARAVSWWVTPGPAPLGAGVGGRF